MSFQYRIISLFCYSSLLFANACGETRTGKEPVVADDSTGGRLSVDVAGGGFTGGAASDSGGSAEGASGGSPTMSGGGTTNDSAGGTGGVSVSGQCDVDEYEMSPVAPTEQPVCLPLTVCLSGQYESIPPTATSDRICLSEFDCELNQRRSCSDTGELGNCAQGEQVCDDNGDWGRCSIVPQAVDSCVPNDDATCDGQNNEGCGCLEGDSRPCAEAGALGACAAGVQLCLANGQWASCSIQPAAVDSCGIPGDDSDCDGSPNTGCACIPGHSVSCGPGNEVGRCMQGTSTCSNNVYGSCIGAINGTSRDCTSPNDNDCDGRDDNVLDGTCVCVPGTIQACDEHGALDGNGPCKAGTQTCELSPNRSSSYWGTCSGSVGPASADSCSVAGDDSNCNGTVNDSCECLSGATTTCQDEYRLLGVCGAGVLSCASSGKWPAESSCDALARTEVCTGGVDEDCDGQIDEPEDCPCLASPCEHGGECIAQGGSDYTCDCGVTGFVGKDCELPVAFTLPIPATGGCKAVSISDDGLRVAATCFDSSGEAIPQYWSQATGWQILQLPPGYSQGRVVAMSAEGQVFAGTVTDAGGSVTRAVRWTSPTTLAQLLSAADTTGNLSATTMSRDGHQITGKDDTQVLVWTDELDAVAYSQTSSSSFPATMNAIDFDGSVIAGGMNEPGIIIWTSSMAAWTSFTELSMSVRTMSADGLILIGGGTSPDISSQMRETAWQYRNNTLTWLDNMDETSTDTCRPESANFDASVIAGWCGAQPVIWRSMVASFLSDLVAEQGGNSAIATAGFARWITADGTIVVGDTSESGGDIFVAHLP